jgi:hypothetical protein
MALYSARERKKMAPSAGRGLCPPFPHGRKNMTHYIRGEAERQKIRLEKRRLRRRPAEPMP